MEPGNRHENDTGVTTEEFDQAVRELALEDGVEVLLSIPGVWETISEFYNNDAIQRVVDGRPGGED